MVLVTILGLLAAACTTGSFIPQVIKTLKTKHTKDLSLATFSVLSVGLLLWLVYGLITRDVPLIAANSISLVLGLIIVGSKVKYK